METVDRLAGVKIDTPRFDYELARRGLRMHELADRADVPASTLSRARHGAAIAPDTLRKLTAALLAAPPLPGGDMLLSEPARGASAVGRGAGTVQEDAEIGSATRT